MYYDNKRGSFVFSFPAAAMIQGHVPFPFPCVASSTSSKKMNSKQSDEDLDKSITLLEDVLPVRMRRERLVDHRSFHCPGTNDTISSPRRAEKGKKGKNMFQHKQQTCSRPEERVAPAHQGLNRRKVSQGWRPKSGRTRNANRSFHSAPAAMQSRDTISETSSLHSHSFSNVSNMMNDSLDGLSFHEASLNNDSIQSLQDLIISTTNRKAFVTTSMSGVDATSLHSLLTEEESFSRSAESLSRSSESLNLWNNSSYGSLCPSIAEGEEECDEDDDDDESRSLAFSNMSFTSKLSYRSKGSALSSPSSSRWNAQTKDSKPRVPELEESFVSLSESNSVALKSCRGDSGGLCNRRLCGDFSPMKPTRKASSHEDSVISSCNSLVASTSVHRLRESLSSGDTTNGTTG